jgi:hypothetical protein
MPLILNLPLVGLWVKLLAIGGGGVNYASLRW